MNMQPKKSLGQNFLRDELVVEGILSAVSPCSGEILVEVGPGEGVLTKKLADSGACVVAIELDDRLIPFLEKKFASYENVHIVHGDVLKVNIPGLLFGEKTLFSKEGAPCYLEEGGEEAKERYRVVGNLPYYITSKIIRMFLELEHSPQEMFFMVQKEVAERICAQKGEMSILSVAVQYYADPEILLDVPARAFDPVPKVDSAFIRIVSKSKDEKQVVHKEGITNFFRVVKIGFSARRKTLVNNLANGLHRERGEVEGLVESIGLKKTVRAQELEIEDWKKLASLFKEGFSR